MPKQASKVCLFLSIVFSILANHSISATTSEQSYAPAASESENKSLSLESLPFLPNPDSPTTEAEAVAETLSPTYFSFPPSSNIPDVETKPNETLSQENVSNLSNADEPSLETQGEQKLFQDLASPPSVDDPTLESNKENTSLPPSKADPPAVETKESEDLFQENTSLPPSPSVDTPAVETKEDENVSQENLFSAENKDNEIPSQENTSVPSSYSPNVDATSLEENKSPAVAPAYVDNTPALDTSDDGSFTQENHSPVTYVNTPAPETKGEEDITSQDYSSVTPPNTESQNPENVPELNDYSSLPKTAVPAPSEAVSFPESDPTIQMTPSNDETFGLAPTSHQTILPFNYRAEDEPVEPYEDEDSWNGVNGAVAGVLVGACVIGVGGFIYQKRKNDNIRAQYTCLAKKGGV
ncbi:Uncharacterized protein TCM_022153 [Theobroma cacao]|uniref:Uncharacterized protein n=1 Tax=Theobroma cacao TaxID=3641 RepID=A0A061EZZ3_THECC|nr:Uncharacterized protein TCM_022153 [Theobroma cacao]